MSLNVISVTPSNGNNSVAIDSNIVIELSDPIDPFTVPTGISLYVLSKVIWDCKELAALDTEYEEVLDIGETNTFFPFDFQIDGNIITLTPSISLLPDAEYFVDIFPGNDATRYLSTKTTGNPLVVSSASGFVEITSAYTGTSNNTFEMSLSSSNGVDIDTIDVTKGITWVGAFRFVDGAEVNIGELTIKLNGSWEIGDSISIPVMKAVGLTEITRSQFITTKYATSTPKSNKIQYVSDSEDALKIVRVYPEDGSINNGICNPIIIKFNKALKPNQDLTDVVNIKRINFVNGSAKNITKYCKIEGDTLKVYMISTARRV